MATTNRVIKIEYLASGGSTLIDGQYLVEYDPTRAGVDPSGRPMLAHIVCSPDKNKAMKFATAADAVEKWRECFGVRPDGKPNRPLTAFTVTIEEP